MGDLRGIPGVGENMERHLLELGYRSLADLRGADPQEMYERDRILHGGALDRCVLYVYRLAVYYARTQEGGRDPEKLKWWRWKD